MLFVDVSSVVLSGLTFINIIVMLHSSGHMHHLRNGQSILETRNMTIQRPLEVLIHIPCMQNTMQS